MLFAFGWLFYDKKYLNIELFKNPFSCAWDVASRDIYYRFAHQKSIDIRWPCSPGIICCKNVVFDPEELWNFMGTGNYYQTMKDTHIYIGSGTESANNVGIITVNHDIKDVKQHVAGKDVIIGKYCWIGMNAVILPGVVLGDNTVVGAGAVVTHSFEKGHCVIGGNPAHLIKLIN